MNPRSKLAIPRVHYSVAEVARAHVKGCSVAPLVLDL